MPAVGSNTSGSASGLSVGSGHRKTSDGGVNTEKGLRTKNQVSKHPQKRKEKAKKKLKVVEGEVAPEKAAEYAFLGYITLFLTDLTSTRSKGKSVASNDLVMEIN